MNLKTLWNWVVTSSEDPNKTSATWSGVLVVLGALLTSWLSSKGLILSDGYVTTTLTSVATGFGSLVTIFGLLRKASNHVDSELNK